MKVALIGSGISGLTCAYLLNRQHSITLFEAADWIGGHTHTVDVTVNGQSHAIDTGFIVFNDWTYPNFIRLLGQLGVSHKPTEMSFSVHDPATRLEYNGNTLNSLFAQRSNLLSPAFWGMLRDILRFNRQAIDDLEQQRIAADTTLGAYLREGRYGERFIQHYIVPMGAAIWSMSLTDMLGFPLQFFVRFFKNHGLLSVSDRPQWRVIDLPQRPGAQAAGRTERRRTTDPRRPALRRQRSGAAHRYPTAAGPRTGLGQLELSPRRTAPGGGDLQHEHPPGHRQ